MSDAGAPRHLWNGPIVDAHHHFWQPEVNDHPWLRPEAHIPFRYGDYSAIKRSYLPPDYRTDAAGAPVVQTVYVETEWNPDDPVGEVRYASALAGRFGVPNAIVAQAWLDRADVGALLAAYAGFPLVKSVRHKPGGPESPAEVGQRRTLMSDPAWRRGFALLAGHGLRFDLQTPWWNLDEAATLANDSPETTIILNHAGLPAQRDKEGLSGWRDAMRRLAACPNVAVKISGIGVPGQPWASESTLWIVRTAVILFGAHRCMFASNFPVDSLCARYTDILEGCREALAEFPEAEQQAFFAGSARRVYALPEPNRPGAAR